MLKEMLSIKQARLLVSDELSLPCPFNSDVFLVLPVPNNWEPAVKSTEATYD